MQLKGSRKSKLVSKVYGAEVMVKKDYDVTNRTALGCGGCDGIDVHNADDIMPPRLLSIPICLSFVLISRPLEGLTVRDEQLLRLAVIRVSMLKIPYSPIV